MYKYIEKEVAVAGVRHRRGERHLAYPAIRGSCLQGKILGFWVYPVVWGLGVQRLVRGFEVYLKYPVVWVSPSARRHGRDGCDGEPRVLGLRFRV